MIEDERSAQTRPGTGEQPVAHGSEGLRFDFGVVVEHPHRVGPQAAGKRDAKVVAPGVPLVDRTADQPQALLQSVRPVAFLCRLVRTGRVHRFQSGRQSFRRLRRQFMAGQARLLAHPLPEPRRGIIVRTVVHKDDPVRGISQAQKGFGTGDGVEGVPVIEHHHSHGTRRRSADCLRGAVISFHLHLLVMPSVQTTGRTAFHEKKARGGPHEPPAARPFCASGGVAGPPLTLRHVQYSFVRCSPCWPEKTAFRGRRFHEGRP